MVKVQAYPKSIEVELEVPAGKVQLVRKGWDEAIDFVGKGEQHHLELSLLSRPTYAEASYIDLWGEHRYEPIGELFFVPAGFRVRARSNCVQQHSVVVWLDPEFIRRWMGAAQGEELEWTDARLKGALEIVNPGIRSLMFRIGEEVRSPGFASATLVELMVMQVVIELGRYLRGIDNDKAMGGLSPWRLRLIDERLEQDNASPTLQELADLCNLSVRHLTRAFRVSRGRTIGSYVAEARMNQAKRLLASGQCVKSVAYEMGFAAPTNFAAAFRRATGETPRQYKQRASRKIPGAVSGLAVTH